ncbi:MAG: DUF4292 domain-containing protein [Anditalea sp.]
MNSRFLLAFFLTLIFLSGCAKKPLLYSTDEIMEEFDPNYLDFDYLSAKSRIVLEEQSGRTTRGVLNLRAKKDSVIWFSLSPGLGIEAARGIITKEEIKIKDRINGKEIHMTYDKFEEEYGVKLSLYLFQNILFANVPHEFGYRDRVIRIGKTFELLQRRENVRYKSIISASHGKVMELETVSKTDDGKVSAIYPEFKDVENQPFAHKILINMVLNLANKPKSRMLVNLEINKVDLTDGPLSFPFNF